MHKAHRGALKTGVGAELCNQTASSISHACNQTGLSIGHASILFYFYIYFPMD